MFRWLRRLVVLSALGAGVAAGYDAVRKRLAASKVGPVATWPPLEPAPRPFVEVPVDQLSDEPTHHLAPLWVEPVDGQCPAGYPVKGNADSGIFHVPGGRFYDRTVPERCYATAADAEADGFRPAKS